MIYREKRYKREIYIVKKKYNIYRELLYIKRK